MDQKRSLAPLSSDRLEGWTPRRQLAVLDALALTGSLTPCVPGSQTSQFAAGRGRGIFGAFPPESDKGEQMMFSEGFAVGRAAPA